MRMRSDELSGFECVSVESRASAPACSPSRISWAASSTILWSASLSSVKALASRSNRRSMLGAGGGAASASVVAQTRIRQRFRTQGILSRCSVYACGCPGSGKDSGPRAYYLDVQYTPADAEVIYRKSQTEPYARPEPISAPATTSLKKCIPSRTRDNAMLAAQNSNPGLRRPGSGKDSGPRAYYLDVQYTPADAEHRD